MRARLAACVLLLASGCLESNPDWDRPGETGDGADTATDTVADATTETESEAGSMSAGDGDESSTTGDGDGDTSESTGTDTTGDGDGDSLNECTFERAQDLTGMPTVTITDIMSWDPGHRACIIVDAGTAIRWESQSFTAHPVIGGEAGMPDPNSPITQAGPGMENTPLEIVLSDPGTFPYYCELHPMNMFGVVYVV